MAKLTSTVKGTIRNRFIRLLLWLLFLFSCVVMALFLYINLNNEKLVKEREALIEKDQIVRNMKESFNGIFFRSRGYYAFKHQNELNSLYEEMSKFEAQLQSFNTLQLSKEELELYAELKQFLTTYRNDILPQAIGFVEADNYKALRELSSGGTNELINKFITYTKVYKEETEIKLGEIYNKMQYQIRILIFLYALLGITVFVIVGIILRRVIQNLIAPMEKLTVATDAFAKGGYVDISNLKKNEDEIGILATSFDKMTRSIQEKEEVLTTQNEELLAQQNELQGNQLRLQQSLSQLEQYNELTHVLTFTLEKMKLLEHLHSYLRRIYEFDSSILYLVDSKEYVTKGLAQETSQLIIQQFEKDKMTRLMEDKSFVIRREIEPVNTNIAQVPYNAYDLYSSILNSENKLVAVLLATREGHGFSKQDLVDINGLMNQASIAFERIFMYEQVERARKLNQTIINTANEGIQYVSKLGDILLINKAFFRIIHYPKNRREEKIPQHIWLEHFQKTVHQSEDLISFLKSAMLDEFTTTRTLRYSINKDEPLYVEVYATSVFERRKKVGTMFVHRDITNEYEVDQMKSELVSTVSHELRTPLSSVLGFTELLLTKDVQPERQRKYIETIHKEAERLTNLINDFLDIQRMESGNQIYSMEKIPLAALTEEVINSFQIPATHHVSIQDQSENAIIIGDDERIVQLFINLLGNAIKFSPNGGEIIIKLVKDEPFVKVSIQDQGIGIPESALPTLFQKFMRVDNSARRKIGGTGLGLALSKEIVSKHNGEIWIESQEGVGTTVYFTLPMNQQN